MTQEAGNTDKCRQGAITQCHYCSRGKNSNRFDVMSKYLYVRSTTRVDIKMVGVSHYGDYGQDTRVCSLNHTCYVCGKVQQRNSMIVNIDAKSQILV